MDYGSNTRRMCNKPEHTEEQPKQHTIRVAGKRGSSKNDSTNFNMNMKDGKKQQ